MTTSSQVPSFRLFPYQPQTTRRPRTMMEKEVIPPPLPILKNTTEPNQLTVLRKLFQDFVNSVNQVVIHNGTSYQFRDSISIEMNGLETTFGEFFHQATKQCGTQPVLCQGIKPGYASSTSLLRKSGMRFLQNWRHFASDIIDLSNSGPTLIYESIEKQFTDLEENFEIMIKAKVADQTVHNQSKNAVRAYKQQLKGLHKELNKLLSNQAENEENVKTLAKEIKTYSRLLNESYSKEFPGCGININDLLQLKGNAYTSCSSILHGIRASYLFDSDIKEMFKCFDLFQELLSTILERLNLPQSYLILRNTSGLEGTPRSMVCEEDEEENEFARKQSLIELIEQGQGMSDKIASNEALFNQFIEALRNKASRVTKKLSTRNNEVESLKIQMERESANYEEIIRTEQTTNQTMSEKIARLIDDNDEKEREISYLRSREEDNEFKKCLRGVAKQLGGVLKEESVHFEDDEDDDQLIQYVNALSVYVVEKKCHKCDTYAERESQMRDVFNMISGEAIDDEDVIDASRRAREAHFKLIEQLEKTKQKKKELKSKHNYFTMCYKQILEMTKTEDDETNLADQAMRAVEITIDEHKREVTELEERKNQEFNNFSFEVVSSFIDALREKDDSKSVIELLKSCMQQYKDDLDQLEKYQSLANECQERLSKHLNIDPPDLPLIQSIQSLLLSLETIPNPLKPLVQELQVGLNEALNALHIMCNRLRGITQFEAKVDPINYQTKQLTSEIMKMLDIVHDMIEKGGKDNKGLVRDNNRMRTCLETLDMQMHKYLTYEDIDLKKIKLTELITRCGQFCSAITKPSASKNFLPISFINEQFSQVFDILTLTSKEDPKLYIPEICSCIVSLHNSVSALSPFAETLNEISGSFTGEFSAFDPSSDSYKFLRNKVFDLHRDLNELPSAKVNSIVILVLTRFISLYSSFISILSAIQYDEENEEAQETFFGIQKENETLRCQIST